MTNLTRRELLAAAAAFGTVPGITLAYDGKAMITKPIPMSGEALPVIGLGTYSVFDVASTESEIAERKLIVERLSNAGGCVIDTSPMYNRSEKVIGDVFDAGSDRERVFIATKVWTDGKESGARQMQRSADLMNTDVVDLMQVHNLRDTEVHMESIRDLQAQKKIRYNGLTHYTASAHALLAKEMREYKPDFIQINYSLGELEADDLVLPLAQELGIAVLINRPFQSGRLFRAVSGKALPDWATEFAESWGQFFLKFIVSHPAVTCTIPATSKPQHMLDNLGAGMGELPDARLRKRMLDHWKSL